MGHQKNVLAVGLLMLCSQVMGGLNRDTRLELVKPANSQEIHIPGTVCNTQLPEKEQICKCTRGHWGLQVDCYQKHLNEIPKNIPKEAELLNLVANNIKEIKTGQLNHLVNLKSLYLMENHIKTIETNAFRNLRNLTELHLDKNHLKQIVAASFYHLHNVLQIYLESNPINIIAEDAFMLLKSLSNVHLNNIKLTCNCNALHLRRWANASGVNLVNAACDGKPLENVPEKDFGGCIINPPNQECLDCQQATGIRECFATGNESQCQAATDICFTNRSFPGGRMSSGCMDEARCLSLAASTSPACNEGTANTCYWCCVGPHCAKESTYEDYVHVMVFEMQFLMHREYHQDLNDENSEKFQELQEEIHDQLDLSFANIEGEHTSYVERFSKGSIIVHGRIESIVDVGDDVISVRDGIHDALLDVRSPAGQLDIAPNSIMITNSKLCNRETSKSISKGDIDWPTVYEGQNVVEPCPADPTSSAKAIRYCEFIQNRAIWREPDLSACPVLDERLAGLENLTNVPITQETVSHVCRDLNNLTHNSMSFNPMEVQLVSLTVENIVSSDVYLEDLSGVYLLNSISNMIQVPTMVLEAAQSQHGSINRLASQVELFGQRFDKTKLTEEEIFISTELGVSVGALASYKNKVVKFEASVDGGIEIVVTKNDLPRSHSNPAASIVLPSSIFEEISNQVSPNVQFTVYDSPVLFEIMTNASQSQNPSFKPWLKNEKETKMRINSRVVAVSFGNLTINNTADPIELILSHDVQDATDPQCSFWSFQDEKWSEAGCRVHEFLAGKYTVCHCDHLTNFALIMDIFGRGQELSEGHQKALSILSYIGMTFSILGLSVTLITYLAFRNLRRDKPARILINLCCALLALCISFVLNTQPNIIQNDVACKMLAGMLHYFTLSSLCWMGVEAFYMYLALVRVFQTYFTHFMAKCCLVGWGIPSIVVIITYAVTPNNYVNMENICWLERNAFYGAFLAPVSAVLVFNGIVFGMVMYQLRQISKKPDPAMNRKSSLLLHLKGTMSVMSLLGLTWLFAFFAIGGAGIVFNYLFVIFNTSQGLFIFLFYCVFKKDVQVAWLAVVRTRGKTVPDSGSTSRVPTGMTRSTRVAVGPVLIQAVEHSSDQASAAPWAAAVGPPSQAPSRSKTPRSVW